MIDPLGRITEYDYSGGDRLSGRIDPSGAYTDWQYYVDFGSTPIVRIDPHLPTEDPALYTTTYDVDVDNGNFDRILRINLPSGGTVHFDYDSRGNRTAVRSDDGNGGSRTVWSATYGPNGEILTQTDRSGTTVNQYTAGITEPTRITDVFGVVTDASYNSRGQLASMITRSPWQADHAIPGQVHF